MYSLFTSDRSSTVFSIFMTASASRVFLAIVDVCKLKNAKLSASLARLWLMSVTLGIERG